MRGRNPRPLTIPAVGAPILEFVAHSRRLAWFQHETPAPTERGTTTRRRGPGNDDAVEPSRRRVREVEGEPLAASPVEEQLVRVGAYPPFRSPHLLRGLHDRLPEPPTPVQTRVSRVRVGTILVRKDDDVVPEHDEEVCHFLPVTIPDLTLVLVDTWISPERQERPLAQASQVALRRRHPGGFIDRPIAHDSVFRVDNKLSSAGLRQDGEQERPGWCRSPHPPLLMTSPHSRRRAANLCDEVEVLKERVNAAAGSYRFGYLASLFYTPSRTYYRVHQRGVRQHRGQVGSG
jgi:hypothetical protein